MARLKNSFYVLALSLLSVSSVCFAMNKQILQEKIKMPAAGALIMQCEHLIPLLTQGLGNMTMTTCYDYLKIYSLVPMLADQELTPLDAVAIVKSHLSSLKFDEFLSKGPAVYEAVFKNSPQTLEVLKSEGYIK